MSDLAREYLAKYSHFTQRDNLDNFLDFAKAVVDDMTRVRPIDEWDEDMGDVLCWTVPVSESPVITSPISSDYPESTTHFSKLLLPSNLTDDGQYNINEG